MMDAAAHLLREEPAFSAFVGPALLLERRLTLVILPFFVSCPFLFAAMLLFLWEEATCLCGDGRQCGVQGVGCGWYADGRRPHLVRKPLALKSKGNQVRGWSTSKANVGACDTRRASCGCALGAGCVTGSALRST